MSHKNQSGGRFAAYAPARDSADTEAGGRLAYGAGPVVTDQHETSNKADDAAALMVLARARVATAAGRR